VKRARSVAASLGMALVLLASARPVESWLVRQRNERHGGYSLSDFGPRGGRSLVETVSTACLGGLRGIIADLLWMRTIRMEQQGRVYEKVALLDGILRMQPHFTSVWVYQARVLVFDHGSALENPSAEEAYRWIRRGIDVLERGIERNRASYRLHFVLADVYMRKLSPRNIDRRTWRRHLRLWEGDLVREAEDQSKRARWPEPLRDWYRDLKSAGKKAGARDLTPAGVREWYEGVVRSARARGGQEPVFDAYLGLKMAQRHYRLAAGKPDVTRSRKLLCQRLAIRCFEHMGHWREAEAAWISYLEALRRSGEYGPGSSAYRANASFFRQFMRHRAADLLTRGKESESREVHRRMKTSLKSVPDYRGLIAEEVRGLLQMRQPERSRALYEVLRDRLKDTRTYEEVVKAPVGK